LLEKVLGNSSVSNTIKEKISRINAVLKSLAGSPAMLELKEALKEA